MIEAARNGDLEELKRLKQTGYNFNVVNWVSIIHVMLNYTTTSLIIQLLKLVH